MKEIKCDICGKRMGGNYEAEPLFVFPSEPRWSEFYVNYRNDMDICSECENALRNAVHETIERLKKRSERN